MRFIADPFFDTSMLEIKVIFIVEEKVLHKSFRIL